MATATKTMTTILLIRHATNAFVGNTLAGRMAGVSLSEEGKRQAGKLAERLRLLPIKALYSSPLERAIETAEPLSEKLNLPVQVRNEFTEFDFGRWTGKTIEELRGNEDFRLFNVFRSTVPAPDGELMLAAQARIVSGLQQLCRQHPNEMIALFSHSDMLKAAIAHYAGIHLDHLQRIEIDPASVSVVVVYAETARIIRLNDTGGWHH
jgi:probable phosphomutase (TIGR03848 family)